MEHALNRVLGVGVVLDPDLFPFAVPNHEPVADFRELLGLRREPELE